MPEYQLGALDEPRGGRHRGRLVINHVRRIRARRKEKSVHGNLAPKKGAKVVVAMSGGVDSSVAAGWLKEQGYEVIGISLQLHDMAASIDNKFGTCCSLSDISDARRVAEKLEIPFYVTNMEEEFHASVVDDFVHEYLVGSTPNPCVRCNEKVKFRHLMDWALDLGADFLATGHYANKRYNPETGQHELLKGMDPDKDQSYFLFTMKQEDLGRSLFPVGGFEKKQVRELARRLGLAVADKPDSQEICFVQARNYKDFIEQQVPPDLLVPGVIVDNTGKELGQHTGLHQFTIGQRKGLGVYSKDPLYVFGAQPAPQGSRRRAGSSAFPKELHRLAPELDQPAGARQAAGIQGKDPLSRERDTQSRSALFWITAWRCVFSEPQRAITPGQAIVFYKDDCVVGGGWIEDLSLN